MTGQLPDEHPGLDLRKAEHARAVDRVDAALKAIERRSAEPDHWQCAFLAQAIAMIFAGLYSVVRTDVLLAMTPERDRERSGMPTLPPDPLNERLTLADLRAALRQAQMEPVRRYPRLGPVRFTREEN